MGRRPLRVFLTGADGLLGTAFTAALGQDSATAGWQLDGVSRGDFDIADGEAVDRAIHRSRPEIVIHAAAQAVVDDCERDPRMAMRVNVTGTRNVVRACRRSDIRVIYMSSDYVFDGATAPADGYAEADLPAPRNVYGMTKLAGERIAELHPAHLIVRTSWLFGGHDENVDNVLAMMRAAQRNQPSSLIADQFSRPTYAADLARTLIFLITRPEPITGVIHVANRGRASWYDVGCHLASAAGGAPDGWPQPRPIGYADAGFVGDRPLDSTLRTGRLENLGFTLPTWQDAVSRFRSTVQTLAPADSRLQASGS
jgi:dTDP-4-dehydrorhamnose reductase